MICRADDSLFSVYKYAECPRKRGCAGPPFRRAFDSLFYIFPYFFFLPKMT